MRILHVAPSIERAYGGPTQSLAGYVSASRLKGAKVEVAAPRASAEEIEALEHAGASRVITFAAFGSGGTASSPALVRWLRRNGASFDVVHVHGLFNFISTFGARAAIATGVPTVIRPFGTLSKYTFGHRRSALKRGWFNALERPNLLRAAALHFTTATERDEAEWHRLPLGPRSHVVPPPFVAPAGMSAPRSQRAERSALFVGRLHPVKNLEALIDAWPAVIATFPDARLVIAGSGSPAYSSGLQRLAAERGISSKVEFAGFLSGADKDRAFAEASLFVLPSHHENFGLAALEAIAAGLPVVISEHVQLRDFVAEHHLGIVADGSSASLAAAVARALGDDVLRDRVAGCGRELTEATYSPAAVGERLSAMYLAAVESHRNRLIR
jgi:glycosyltransferase involved in cell wall biosynthesis